MHKNSTAHALATIDEIREMLQRAQFVARRLEVRQDPPSAERLSVQIQQALLAADTVRANLQSAYRSRNRTNVSGKDEGFMVPAPALRPPAA
jgi:hypothetical protein